MYKFSHKFNPLHTPIFKQYIKSKSKFLKLILIIYDWLYFRFSKLLNLLYKVRSKVFKIGDITLSAQIKHKVVDGVELKRCGKCKQWLLLDHFCKDKSAWDSLNHRCKSCQKQSFKQSYIKHPIKRRTEHKIESGIELKYCNKCKQWLSLDYFSKDKSKWDGLRNRCKACQKKYDKQWRIKNIEQIKQYNIEHAKQKQKYAKIYSRSLAKYKTFTHQIDFCEEVRKSPDNSVLLEVKCTYCGRWFKPTNSQVQHRIKAINGTQENNSENHFYCSEDCRHSCCEYYKKKYPEGFTPDRDNRPQVKDSIRKKLLEMADYTCEFCEETENLELHHIRPVALFPELTNDIGNMFVVCPKCHLEEHNGPNGLSYNEIAKLKEEKYLAKVA